MKFAAIVLLAVLGAANADLRDDLSEIWALVPKDDIKAIARDYYANDAGVQNAVAYMRGDDFQSLVAKARETDDWVKFKNYMNDAGMDIYGFIGKIHDLLWSGSSAASRSSRVLNRGVTDMLRDIYAIIPVADIRAKVNEKRESSADFQEFWSIITGPKAQGLAKQAADNEVVQGLVQKLTDEGVDVARVVAIVKAAIGWE